MTPINRDFYKKGCYKITESFLCPSCQTGHVRFTESKIEKYDIRDNGIGFIGTSMCGSCEENLSVVGKVEYYTNSGGSPVIKGYTGTPKHPRYTPVFFYPTLNIFSISAVCPPNVKNATIKAFSHYWNDLSASANCIRKAVELILIPFFGKEGTLDSRISKYRTNNQVIGDRLMALKWIGNDGSHEDTLTQDDILDGFDILQSVIYELYDHPNKTQQLAEMAAEINKNKGGKSKQI